MSKFDDEVNDILTRKIKERKHKASRDIKPRISKSPALKGGVVGSKEMADTPMPLQIGV